MTGKSSLLPDTRPGNRPARATLDSVPLSVTLLIPTLNEIVGMKAIMPQIRREWVDQILILDGNSTDGTAQWAREKCLDMA